MSEKPDATPEPEPAEQSPPDDPPFEPFVTEEIGKSLDTDSETRDDD